MERGELRRGQAAEQAVAAWLRAAGWDIVGTNLRVGRLELDVVARRDRVIAVVEVRSRGTGAWTTPLGSIGTVKRLRIRRAGERLWQRRFKHDPTVDRLRFDAASVTFENGAPRIEYVVAAF
ncbi:MAG: YraN family protein [Sorangiineae bacterium]|nr:YraN family protein [Sorangiineae bacterium]